MFKNIVLLLCAISVLSFRLGTTLEELKVLLAEMDEVLKVKVHEAQIEIRATLTPLAYYTNNAKTNLIVNLTEAAKPYWAEIASLKEQAAASGQDISVCIELGNNQLYILNQSTVASPWRKIELVYHKGYNIFLNSSSAALSVLDDLLDLEARAQECSDDTCADELGLEATNMYKTSLGALSTAVNVAYEYSITNLPNTLADINIDSDVYVQNYSSILEDIKSCISKQ